MSTGASNGTPAIAVEALWQVFGPDAERQLKQALGAGKPAPEAADNLRAAVNFDYVDPAHLLEAGDEVAFFPPVTGG